MASERETTVSNEGSSGLLFLPWSFLSWATTPIRPPRVSRWEGQRSFLSRGERSGVSRLCYVTRRHSFLLPPFPIIASLLPKIMYTLLYARSSFTARRIDESNDNIYFRVESGLLRSFSYTFSSSSYTLEKSFLRITKSAETLPTIDRSLFDSLVSSPLPSHRCYQIFSFLALRILYVETHTLKFIVIPAGKYIAVDLP